ncbi:hypothetical protein BUALT_BualtUnG0023800 [Buddleja alternifolia]|uniref:Uncharacterized protein n=1 Tax=Buddleja alternifolia TaxID=168488 RepID=A0AAV6VZ44_9LAMI|nr:hypothetical protein BUALT_BualtUnG0023700 [Buddleja alternifolia]KAG8362922.1 hypothetical protein BUALT_BualtUnG0023800 [Buddleja alternifolia]
MKCQDMIICFCLLILASAASSQHIEHVNCPFQYLYHFGDGFTDVGNSIHVPSRTPNPAARLPYGRSSPGWPTGRWSDGLNDFDFAATDFGLPHLAPYLNMNDSENYDGVIFSVARSPVLDINFFKSRGIKIPPYAAVPLSAQLRWFKNYLNSNFPSAKERATRMETSFLFLGDIEGNDIGYALTQGKSIEEVQTYVPLITRAQIRVARELIRMGATRLIIPGNAPLGCFPYILTALHSNNSRDYDELGCLKSVNDLIVSKNDYLQQAIRDLNLEFPNIIINYGAIYDGTLEVIRDASYGPNGELALMACCGTGGKYNYDSKRFCGGPQVPVCRYPNQYIFWDGIHFTHHAYSRIETILIEPALRTLGCTRSVNSTTSNLSASV